MTTRTDALVVHVLGLGIAAPGLADWATTRSVLRGEAAYQAAATVVSAPQRLPATERRRAGTIIKVSINVADEALAMSGVEGAIPTVFSASEGDGKNCHELCEALAVADRTVSPTRFTNSVHNAAAGYWHIAAHSMAPSTSLCAFDASFGAGLIEAALQATTGDKPVLLVVADQPYPEPLHRTRPLQDAMGLAMVLSASPHPRAVARLSIALVPHASATACTSPALEGLRQALPAARGLPLLEVLARGGSGDVHLACYDNLALHVRIA